MFFFSPNLCSQNVRVHKKNVFFSSLCPGHCNNNYCKWVKSRLLAYTWKPLHALFLRYVNFLIQKRLFKMLPSRKSRPIFSCYDNQLPTWPLPWPVTGHHYIKCRNMLIHKRGQSKHSIFWKSLIFVYSD